MTQQELDSLYRFFKEAELPPVPFAFSQCEKILNWDLTLRSHFAYICNLRKPEVKQPYVDRLYLIKQKVTEYATKKREEQ
jgi:hypothetical protein